MSSISDYDMGAFKVLANNDLPSGRGHQAGPLIPAAFRNIFPDLTDQQITEDRPAPSSFISIELQLNGTGFGHAVGRYQLQTWGGTRSGETRVTSQHSTRESSGTPLRDLLALGQAGDILVFRRLLGTSDHFAFDLIRQSDASFERFRSNADWIAERWGYESEDAPPTPLSEMQTAAQELQTESELANPVVQESSDRDVTINARKIRDDAFRTNIRKAYKNRCAISDLGLQRPGSTSLYEIEAAHIIPVARRGTDVVQNGLALSRTLHWAFDHGIICVDPDYRVQVAPEALVISGNSYLQQFHQQELHVPSATELSPSQEALEWHRKSVYRNFDI